MVYLVISLARLATSAIVVQIHLRGNGTQTSIVFMMDLKRKSSKMCLHCLGKEEFTDWLKHWDDQQGQKTQ